MLQKHGSKTPNAVEEMVMSASAHLHYGKFSDVDLILQEGSGARQGRAMLPWRKPGVLPSLGCQGAQGMGHVVVERDPLVLCP